MNERDIAKKITQHLNYGTNQLDRSVLEDLRSARQRALAAHAHPQQVFGMAVAGHGDVHSGHHGHGHHSPRFWIPLVVLLLGLLIAYNWSEINGDDPDDVDATLLAGELPINAYLDSDFKSWLDQSSRR
ncbi:MAG: DUF3619 family protein [Sulfurimicrobium sp.]|jgi:hypothetical protein|nr:DUF3619 family protein [Sulfurimicrobium sp.]MDO9191072.1 DUF3619 family protein [Sulfurimicrobium sp.]MDP1704031.1 DUF3619 family protein [Sulfurimicrobium sp.]MDP1897573.1 DUF3619 family protein [Sulfurimicrobium sp.]MDP2197423.1 DUF3619 family protein [Sulfurimicrobium sp.]